MEQYQASIALKEQFPEGDWRVDTYNTHDNLGLWMDKSCMQFFDSTVAPSILDFYSSLGFTRDVRSNPEAYYYQLRGLLSVRFTIMPEDEQDSFAEQSVPGWTYYDTIEGFALYYYVDEEQLDSLPTQDACALLVRALALTDEDIAAYGGYLEPLPGDQMLDFSYERYQQDIADRPGGQRHDGGALPRRLEQHRLCLLARRAAPQPDRHPGGPAHLAGLHWLASLAEKEARLRNGIPKPRKKGRLPLCVVPAWAAAPFNRERKGDIQPAACRAPARTSTAASRKPAGALTKEAR